MIWLDRGGYSFAVVSARHRKLKVKVADNSHPIIRKFLAFFSAAVVCASVIGVCLFYFPFA
jgi:hypothetical protein